MIERFEIQFIHSETDENIKKYVTKKIGHLDRYLPRASRSSAHAEVVLKEGKASDNRNCTCEVTLHLPHDVINVTEKSINMYTAIDIIELKLKHQIQKYKDLHTSASLRRRLASRFARKPKPVAL